MGCYRELSYFTYSFVLYYDWLNSNIQLSLFVSLMVFNATFSHISVISWRSVLLVEETGENHRPVADKLYQLISNLAMISLDVFYKTCHTGIEFGCDQINRRLYMTNMISFICICVKMKLQHINIKGLIHVFT